MQNVIRQDEIDRYLENGQSFIHDDQISSWIRENASSSPSRIREIISKSLSIERLSPEDTAALLNVKDPELWAEMKTAAGEVKRRVYDNRIVTFAPLYLSSVCVNNCTYCGFRRDNHTQLRHVLTMDEVRKETEACVALGHKKLIVVYGEHPSCSVDYMADSIRAVYDVHVPTKNGRSNSIRRVNVNAAPMSISDLRKLKSAEIGTYQVFQETYHHETYGRVHPAGTIKADYNWRLYSLHRAMDAGIDDVAIGALFGLYDWRFEVMGLLCHAIDLEKRYGNVGPHTISFPRIKPADGVSFDPQNPYAVNDDDFEKIVTVLRLAVPYTGLIVTSRENPAVKRRVVPLGCTQTDAASRLGIGSYSGRENGEDQSADEQQFLLGDTRPLEMVVRDFAAMGLITSFCTAGYRCGRTGDKIMGMLRRGTEAKFCKTNAVLTFREWLDDFADEETKKIGNALIEKEMAEIRQDEFFSKTPALLREFDDYYARISNGERDLYI
jgi:2-iminoacetate synthase